MATNGAAIGTDRRDRFVFGSEIRLALCRRVRRRTSAGQRLRLDACPYRRGFRSDVAGGWLASARQFATERRASFTAAPKKTAGRPTAAKSQTDQIPPSSCSFSSVTWLPLCVTTGGSIDCGYGLDKIVCRCRACSGDACDMSPDGNRACGRGRWRSARRHRAQPHSPLLSGHRQEVRKLLRPNGAQF